VQDLLPYIALIFAGLQYNLVIAVSAFLAGMAVAVASLAISLSSPPAAKLVAAVSRAVRGVPPLVLLAATYWLIFPALGLPSDALLACITAFTLRTWAFQLQILRASAAAVEKGQLEAALSLGLGEREAAFYVVLPQSLRAALPALFNELSSLLKESTLGLALGVLDALARARLVSIAAGYSLVWILAAGLLVYAVSWAALRFSRLLHRRLAVPGSLGARVVELWR
jgi:ABC-type amino acid transport system permease subunit